MLSVVARLKIKDGEMDEALKAVKELIPKVATEEGTIFYSLNKDPNNPGLIVVIERYKDRAALREHSSTAHFKDFFAKIGGLLDGHPEMTVMEELLSVDEFRR